MKSLYKSFEHAIKHLREVSGEIQKLLLDATVSNTDVVDITETIRNEAFDIISACDATEDGYEEMDDDFCYFDPEEF